MELHRPKEEIERLILDIEERRLCMERELLAVRQEHEPVLRELHAKLDEELLANGFAGGWAHAMAYHLTK